jgi:2-polyprenyl-6-methoxyphenol hydroxylase-like FAD-dependent oxidoreductase
VWFTQDRRGIAGALAVFPLPGGRGVGLVPVRHKSFDRPERLHAGWQALLDSDPRIARVVGYRSFPGDFVHIRRPWGHARRYGAAGAMLLGDAAHPVSPAGGQGANMSVADALALADVLSNNGADALSEYERRRRPANARSMRFTRIAAGALSLPPALTGRLLPMAIEELGRRPEWFGEVLRRAAMAFQERPKPAA